MRVYSMTSGSVRRRPSLLIAQALSKDYFTGFGDLGNDGPMAWAYATTDKTVAQRKKDIAKAAKPVKAAAGVAERFERHP